MPSSTYANLPKARVKRRVPLPDFPLADKATRHFVQAQVARSSASEETGPSGSETAPPGRFPPVVERNPSTSHLAPALKVPRGHKDLTTT